MTTAMNGWLCASLFSLALILDAIAYHEGTFALVVAAVGFVCSCLNFGFAWMRA